ncbi:MAG: TIGR04086 family membrane protein [Clostridia bacterium]|nr:TIGR04086 family membrane protein [Clostridia bacterium]
MEKTAKGSFALDMFKGVLAGVSVCLGCILAFALALKFFALPPLWIRIINQAIKLAGILVGCLVGVRGERGFLKGGAVGLAVVAVTFLLFGLVSGGITFGVSTLFEALYGIISGALCGIIAVNLKK